MHVADVHVKPYIRKITTHILVMVMSSCIPVSGKIEYIQWYNKEEISRTIQGYIGDRSRKIYQSAS